MTLPPAHPWAGARVALLTRHRKEAVLAPLFTAAIGATVELVDSVDTDTLGTFTREVPRVGSQLDAARRKALMAVERSGAPWGLGSEGSFSPGPFGLGAWNLEVLVLVNPGERLELIGRARAPGLHHHGLVSSREALAALAERAGFPEHGLVVRPDGEHHPALVKGLRDQAALERAFDEALRASSSGVVFVENDLRAHQHPSRMATIAEAGRDLVERLVTRCPACGSPGFGLVAPVPGLPCRDCGAPTREPRADELACVRCPHREERPRKHPGGADPARCDVCNP